MRTFIVKRIALVAMATLMVTFAAMVGCSSSQPSTQSASAASEESAKPQVDVIVGQESGTAKTLVMKNTTGKTINAVALGESGAEAGSFVSLAIEGDEWADGKTAAINYEPTNASIFDIQLKCGEETYTLHEFNLDGAESVEICMEGDVAYVTLERDGNVISSLSEETAIRDAELAAEAAAAEAEAEAAVVEEQAYYYEEAPTYDAPAQQPAQTQDSCVDGGVVLR